MSKIVSSKVDPLNNLVNGESEIESITFNFPNVEEKELKIDQYNLKSMSNILKKSKKMFNDGDRIYFASDRPNTFKSHQRNGLIGTIIESYSNHIPLILRPDDIWLTICCVFAKYVCSHSEEMRSCFVEHSGRTILKCKTESSFFSMTTESDWLSFIMKMGDMIKKNIKDEINDWLVPNFSTTTFRDVIVGNVILMGTFKEYFEYHMMCACGLSRVTLEGSLTDWVRLVEKTNGLYKFDKKELNDWADLLIPVLKNFVSAYEGKIDEEWWQKICTSITLGSGGEQDYGGWMFVFHPFGETGKYILNSKEKIERTGIYTYVHDNEIVNSMISVPMIVNDTHYHEPINTTLWVGLMMSQYDPKQNTLKPCVDWAIVINKEVTIKDIREKVMNKFKDDDKINNACLNLLEFIEYLIKKLNFPQDSYLELADSLYEYCKYGTKDWRVNSSKNYIHPKNLLPSDLYYGFLYEISNSEYEGRQFNKYISNDDEKIEELIKEYFDSK